MGYLLDPSVYNVHLFIDGFLQCLLYTGLTVF